MINVNKITSMLAKMPDPQLQQYAQMHKNDPYIMALAMSESNRRKEVRAVAPQMAEQPKVVDSQIAQMANVDAMGNVTGYAEGGYLPEDQGIGQIPAGDMNFADGGIIAFADGGDVERYQVGGLFETDPAKLRAMAQERLRLEQIRQGRMVASGPYSSLSSAAPNAASTASSGSFLRNLNPAGLAGYGFGLYHGDLNEGEEAELERRRNMPATITNPAPAAPVDAGREGRRTSPVGSGIGTNVDPNLIPASARPKTKDSAPAANLNSAAPGAKLPTQAGLGGLDVANMTKTALETAAAQPNPFAADVTKIGQEKVAAKEAEVAGLKAIQDKFSDVFKGRKERLDKREGDIETMKDQSLGLSLLLAGARIMQTPGQLAQAVGAGIDTGTKQYAAGLDKVRSAQEKLSDARDRLEDLENNRNEMSARELNKAQNEVKTAGISAREDLLKANMQMFNVNRETALKMVDNQVKVGLSVYEQQQQNARTQMQVNAPSGEMRTAMILGTGKTDAERIESGMKKLQEITSDKSGMAAVKLLSETNAKLQTAGQPPITMAELLGSAREYSALMYPKVADTAPTRERPR